MVARLTLRSANVLIVLRHGPVIFAPFVTAIQWSVNTALN
jgi:hypothetical protein